MCSELFRIPNEVAGVPLFGVGVLMLAWVALAAVGMFTAARAEGWQSAATGHLPTLLLGVAVLWFLPKYFPDGVPIRGYGVMVLTGSVVGIGMAMYRARQVGLDPDEIIRLAVGMFLAGVVGGRLFYVIEYWDQRFHLVDPASGEADWGAILKEVLSYTEGGLVVYGAFIGGMVAFVFHVVRRNLPALALADLIAPSMVAGLAFGRIGCLLNGCCYGGESAVPWAVSFPRQSAAPAGEDQHGTLSPAYFDQANNGRFFGLRIGASESTEAVVTAVDVQSAAEAAGLKVGDRIQSVDGRPSRTADEARQMLFGALHPYQPSVTRESVELKINDGKVISLPAVAPPARSLPVHPTQIYSAVNAALLSWMLWSYYPFRRRDGAVLAMMLTIYPVARFLLEIIRVDESAVFGTGLSISQNISIAIFCGALLFWKWLGSNPPRLVAFPAPPAVAA